MYVDRWCRCRRRRWRTFTTMPGARGSATRRHTLLRAMPSGLATGPRSSAARTIVWRSASPFPPVFPPRIFLRSRGFFNTHASPQIGFAKHHHKSWCIGTHKLAPASLPAPVVRPTAKVISKAVRPRHHRGQTRAQAHTNVDVVVDLEQLRALLSDRLPHVFAGAPVSQAALPWPPS